jgi:DNA-binding beta-propeller fold protein YncE
MNLHLAETKPSSSIVSIATAGCSPVRVVTSADGSDVWVTSRESDALLGFSADSLRTNPRHALIARVNLGASPIGLIMIENGSRMLIANSNLHSQPGASSSLAVVSTPAALAGGHGLLGIIATGLVPREFGITPDGKTLLASNEQSHQLQAIDVGSLP